MSQVPIAKAEKGGVISDSPLLVHYSTMLNLELISPVQIAICPLSTTPDSAIVFNPEGSLYGRGKIAGIVPQQTPADAHSRRDEVPQIPFSDYVGAAVELRQRSRRSRTRRTPRRVARDVGALKVSTHQDRSRGIRRARQPALGTPQKQIMTDQPIMRSLLAT
jgi:hypothetical protein